MLNKLSLKEKWPSSSDYQMEKHSKCEVLQNAI